MPNKSLCIIPARGGSKRFPQKNIAMLAGKPLLAHTIQPALECGLFDRVCVSSDNDEILQIAETYGATPLRRPKQFAEDRTPLVDVARNVIEDFASQGQSYETFALLLTTCPLRTVEDLRASYEIFQTQDANYVVSVSAYATPPQRAVWAPKTYLESYFGMQYMKQTQLLDSLYYCNGAFSWLKTEVFLRENQWTYGSKTLPYLMPPERSIDIDNPADLAYAEFCLERSQKRRVQSPEQNESTCDTVNGAPKTVVSETHPSDIMLPTFQKPSKIVPNKALDEWKGEFGNAYIKRNEISEWKIANCVETFKRIISNRKIQSVLEIGCNIGMNLLALDRLFHRECDLYAVEPNKIAFDRIKENPELQLTHIWNCDGANIPLPDDAVDLAFTRGVLIHIPPQHLEAVTREIVRVSRKYVLCIEYFSHTPTEIEYRDKRGMLFKRDFGSFYLDHFPGLEPVDYGFFWQREFANQGNLNWWLFEKVQSQ